VSHPTDKKAEEKKKRDKFNQLLAFNQFRADSVAAATVEVVQAPAKASNEASYKEDLIQVQGRNSWRKEQAAEKWNRFAGTASAGARGR
jgi:hypothetical protein